MKNFTLLFLSLVMSISVGAQRKTLVKQAKTKNVAKQAQVLGVAGDLINKANSIQKIAASFTPIDQSFETEDTDWTIIDASGKMSTGGAFEGTAAVDGVAYLTSGYDSAASKDAWAISPSRTLEANVTYYIGVYVSAAGYGGVNDEFAITVGQGATAANQTTVLIDKKGANSASYENFTLLKAEFTPTVAGNYNFGIHHCTVAKDVNGVAFDLFQVHNQAIAEEARVVSIAYTGGLCSYATDHGNDVFLPNETTNMYLNATTSNATNFAWMAPIGTNVVGDATTEALVVNNLSAGDNLFTFTASSKGSSDDESITITSKEYAANEALFASNLSPAESATMVTVGENLYVAGPNEYYTQIAESFQMPADATISMTGFIHSAVYAGATIGTQPLTVKVVQATAEGLPGTVIKSFVTTLGEFFTGDASTRSYTFPEAVQVTGSFFIEFDFSTITSTATDNVGFATCWNRTVAVNSLYVNYGGTWTAAIDLFKQGVSSMIVINATITSGTTGIENEMVEKEIATEAYYSLTGTEISKPAEKGIYVKHVVYRDGTSKSVKCIK